MTCLLLDDKLTLICGLFVRSLSQTLRLRGDCAMTMTTVSIEGVEEVRQGIFLTDSAAARVRALLEERNLQGHALRVFVGGGGCSGGCWGS